MCVWGGGGGGGWGGLFCFLFCCCFLHGDEDVLEDVSLEFMCFVFACMPDESYCRRFRSVCCCVRGMSFESCISVCCRVCFSFLFCFVVVVVLFFWGGSCVIYICLSCIFFYCIFFFFFFFFLFLTFCCCCCLSVFLRSVIVSV